MNTGFDNRIEKESCNTIKHNNYNSFIDIIKLFCCILIIGSHCLPLVSIDIFNIYYGQWFFRFSVPFFFISSGYFYSKMDEEKRNFYLKRLAIIFILSTVLYIPFFCRDSLLTIFKYSIFGFSHLWYLSALIISLLMIYIIERLNINKYFFVILLFIGVFFDEYYKIFNCEVFQHLLKIIEWLGGPKHALFFGLPIVIIGEYISENEQRFNNISLRKLCICLILAFSIGFIELILMKQVIKSCISFDVSLFGWTPAVPLMLIAIKYNESFKLKLPNSILLRKTIDLSYIIHIWIISILIEYCKLEYLKLFLVSILVCFSLSFVFVYVFTKLKKAFNYKGIF